MVSFFKNKVTIVKQTCRFTQAQLLRYQMQQSSRLMSSTTSQTQTTINASDRELIRSINGFWFGATEQPDWDRNTIPKGGWQKKWFAGGKETDKQIIEKFGTVVEDIYLQNSKCQQNSKGEQEKIIKYDAWLDDIDGRLAYILWCDQFPRNIYRGSWKAFSLDFLALSCSKKIIDQPKFFNQYKYLEKTFILMPLMHSENAEDGERCTEEFTKLQLQAKNKEKDDELAKQFETNVAFAKSHLDVIQQFGRYPSRNKALSRQNTPEEETYLKSASGWGQ